MSKSDCTKTSTDYRVDFLDEKDAVHYNKIYFLVINNKFESGVRQVDVDKTVKTSTSPISLSANGLA